MKILKCPNCDYTIDSKDIEKWSWRSNPFSRKAIKCLNCEAMIIPRISIFILFWVLVSFGVYSFFTELKIGEYAFLVFIAILFLLMKSGYSHVVKINKT